MHFCVHRLVHPNTMGFSNLSCLRGNLGMLCTNGPPNSLKMDTHISMTQDLPPGLDDDNQDSNQDNQDSRLFPIIIHVSCWLPSTGNTYTPCHMVQGLHLGRHRGAWYIHQGHYQPIVNTLKHQQLLSTDEASSTSFNLSFNHYP